MRIQYVRTNEKELHIQNSLMSFSKTNKTTKEKQKSRSRLVCTEFSFDAFERIKLCFRSTRADEFYLNHKTCTRWRR